MTVSPGPDGAADKYNGGELDGDRAVLISVQDTGKLERSFASIRVLKNGNTVSVPLKYLKQTPPEKKGDRVIVMDIDAAYKAPAGTVCTVAASPVGSMVILNSERGSLEFQLFSVNLYEKS